MKRIASIKKMLAITAVAGLLATGFSVVASPRQVSAAGADLCHDSFSSVTYNCPDTSTEKVDGKSPGKFDKTKCYVYKDPNKGWQPLPCTNAIFNNTTTIPAPAKQVDQAIAKDCPDEIKSQKGGCDLIARYVNPLITTLTVLVGIIVVISIVIGGIQYSTARNNPSSIQAAKSRIANALLAFLAYSLLWGFLQWVIPGGFLKG